MLPSLAKLYKEKKKLKQKFKKYKINVRTQKKIANIS